LASAWRISTIEPAGVPFEGISGCPVIFADIDEMKAVDVLGGRPLDDRALIDVVGQRRCEWRG
jgi:hypothetical protein